jgi:tripartite-type tricarboxylate transporter receptor subunit TctC
MCFEAGKRIGLVLAGVFFIYAAAALSQDYPSKAIRVIVPYAAGGGGDVVTRIVMQRLTNSLGKSVVVENRTGGSGIAGTQAVATAAADGYTFLQASATNIAVLPFITKLPYSPGDFAPITVLGSQPHVVVVPSALPVKSIADLVALAKRRPGELNYGSSGNGGPNHLGTELFKLDAGVQITHIPYKGNGLVLIDLVSGQIQLGIMSMAPTLPHIKTGKLRALAVTSPGRSPVLPELPTVAESGYPGYEVRSWYGLFAPVKTPRAIVVRLNDEIAAVLKQRDTIETFAALGVEPGGNSVEDFTAFIRSETGRWGRVVKAINLKIDP